MWATVDTILVWGQGIYGKSVYISHSFAINLNLLQKIFILILHKEGK